MSSPRMVHRAFRHLIEECLGLVFGEDKAADLDAGLRKATQVLGIGSLEELFERLERADPDGEVWAPLREHLTTGETYFFRDPGQLEVIRRCIFPAWQEAGAHRIRIWSAGCSTGEEAYTLAMMAAEAFPAVQGWQVEVLGTDLNETALARAQAGVYREWSFRGLPHHARGRWFTESRSGWTVAPALRALVRFRSCNLVQDPFPSLAEGGGFDLILCRNVFIYFKAPVVRDIVRRFSEVLRPGGALVVGHNELGIDTPEGLNAEVFPDSVVLRPKGEAPPPPVMRPAPVRPLAALPRRPEPPPPPRAVPSRSAKPDPLDEAAMALAAGDHARALELARDAMPRVLRRDEALRLAAMALANLGRVAEALAMVDEALGRNPASHRIHYLRSLLASEMGHSEEGLRSLDRALVLAPDHVPSLVDRGRMHAAAGRWREADGDLERALACLEKMEPWALVEGLEAVEVREVLQHCRSLRERALAMLGRGGKG